jgi:hypothetical protein
MSSTIALCVCHAPYMSVTKSLQISSRITDSRSTLEQERFSFLLAEIEKVRRAQTALEGIFLKFRRDHTDKLAPLRSALKAACRETVFALDRLLDQPGWSRLDRVALEDMLRGTAEALLESTNGDSEIKAIYDKHSRVGFDSIKQEQLQRLKEHAEELGFDLGDAKNIRSEEDLMQRMYEEMSAREDAEELRQSSRKGKRKSAAQMRSEDNAKLAKQTLRELYRKLASIVHPDRERDPARREAKNLLMQKINQAYAANDLMSLFEAQMEVEQTDAAQIGNLGAQRLKQYNKLLAEQLAALKEKLKELEVGFCMDLGLPPMSGITAAKLNRLIREQARGMRAEIARQEQLLNLLANKAATKRWLKGQRRFARGDFDLEDPDAW